MTRHASISAFPGRHDALIRAPSLLIGVFLCLAALSAWAQAPTLVPAALNSVSPAGVVRGKTVTLTLDGINIAGATHAIFDDTAITGELKPGANRNQVKLETVLAPTTRPGIHRVFLRTPLGTTGSVTFAVGAWPELSEKEPNDDRAAAPVAVLPATMVGSIGRVGDTDWFRFEAQAGQELVFDVEASQIRSALLSELTLVDGSGKVLAAAHAGDGRADAILGYRFEQAGIYAIGISDFQNAAGGNLSYRINAGPFSSATSVFPLGIRKGEGEVTLQGWNLGAGQKVRVTGGASGWGAVTAVSETPMGPLLDPVRLAVGDEPEILEADASHDSPAHAQPVTAPATLNGRISASAGADYYRFHATRGQSLVVEVHARRLGSELDSHIEILDAAGKPIERARLRCVAETSLTLSDRDSASGALRFLAWNDFRVNDFVYVRGEVAQITLLPRGPDEDVKLRTIRGQRAGFLDTTPVSHAVSTSIYKVQIHPPGTKFPPNGMPVVPVYYRNDDGGPLYGKDSRLSFTPPADGDYLVRIRDIRGEGSDRHAYRLTIRPSRPDFRLSLGTAHPSIPAGSSVPVEVTADRLDGFDGPIEVSLEGLPAGISATSTVIEAGELTASLLLTAEPGAATPGDGAPVRLVGRADAAGVDLRHAIDLGGARSYLTVLPPADLTLVNDRSKITMTPGSEQNLDASISRRNGFAGRVPVDVKNLPFGVRILDVGLNGVLITEKETSRRFTLLCEPWVKPQQRLIYCTVRTETGSSAPTEIAAVPILLEIVPKGASRAAR